MGATTSSAGNTREKDSGFVRYTENAGDSSDNTQKGSFFRRSSKKKSTTKQNDTGFGGYAENESGSPDNNVRGSFFRRSSKKKSIKKQEIVHPSDPGGKIQPDHSQEQLLEQIAQLKGELRSANEVIRKLKAENEQLAKSSVSRKRGELEPSQDLLEISRLKDKNRTLQNTIRELKEQNGQMKITLDRKNTVISGLRNQQGASRYSSHGNSIPAKPTVNNSQFEVFRQTNVVDSSAGVRANYVNPSMQNNSGNLSTPFAELKSEYVKLPRAPSAQTLEKQAKLNQVKVIDADTRALEIQVDRFQGSKHDKEYLNLNEMLLRNLYKLDAIESLGQMDLRAEKKSAILLVKECQNKLNAKVV